MDHGTTGAGGAGGGLTTDPRLLAGVAGGLLAACLALWSFRGLPLGAFAFWVSALPLFLAGIGFGTVAAAIAAAVAIVAILFAGTAPGAWVFGLGFGLPAVLLVGVARRAGLGPALGLLGLVPAAGIIAAAVWLADQPGGLEGTLDAMIRLALARMEVPATAVLISDIVRVKAAAIGFWLALALLLGAVGAGAILGRLGLGPRPAWSTARLPAGYIALPALAFGFWLAADAGADAVRLSLLLVLLVPLLLHGLAVLHTASRGFGGRRLLLGAVYCALVILFVPASLAVAGYGAFDLIRRPSSRNKGGGGGVAPPSTPQTRR